MNVLRSVLLIVSVPALALAVAACGDSAAAHAGKGQIAAVGAENEYANVISQVGGRYVSVNAIESNPNTDPHTFEASPTVAQVVGSAQLVVQNGVGYDSYMNKIESAQPSSTRRVIDVQKLLGLPDSTPNPHLWYKPGTMAAVGRAVEQDLAALQPDHAAYFAAHESRFAASLEPWYAALKQFAVHHPNTPVAVTEPVGDYMLQAAGARILTPFTLQTDIMNGVDPAPQDVTLQRQLLAEHRVKVFVYNQQVTDTLTNTFLTAARQDGIPVVGVYETMPVPGYDYQSWMLAEVKALERAVTTGASTERLR
ncbi:MAG TPA: zinc ABC transporter substrate-binding protein [Solirubrobacteraceae bacterium]|nr:zinc ABC transporter substrate-binding protein [Solirubrobacteraceae bacterium]